MNGCSSQPKKTTLDSTNITTSISAPSPEELISKAISTNDKKEQAKLYLFAAQRYYTNKLISQSSAVVRDIDINILSSDDAVKALLLNLQLAIHEDLDWHLQTSTDLFQRITLSRTNIDTLKTLIPLASQMYKKQNQTITSAILLIEYAGILDHTNYSQLNNDIWQLLRSTDPIQLNNYTYKGQDADTEAWLELAIAIQQNQISLENQYLAYQKWQKKWPSHPATSNMPRELELLSKLPKIRPSQIIIALPFTGPIAEAGKAIRDGFIASYLTALSQHNTNPTKIDFFDTNKNTIESLYSKSHTENTLIIGPLTKNNVKKLQTLDLSNPTTLALNYLETSPPLTLNQSDKLYQFGLDPETEINQLSTRLSKRHLNKVAFIAPENDHGFRIHDSLLRGLEANQSIIIESVYYQDQKSLSPSVAKLLATDQSTQRKNKIQRITNLSFEFEPRRRNDIDAIFMLAKPQIASQLNPLFAYHYARDLPIYSSSQIHQINEQQNDLDNIFFLEIPWMLSNTIDIKNTITNALPSAKREHSRFFALGADTFTLAPRLQILKEIQDSQVQGHTGILSIDRTGIIHRKLELAVFRRGKAIAIKE
tara:strand:- start:499 stop:2283 length:1785 start_codon:yes stop_codon:yes gene_type:complete